MDERKRQIAELEQQKHENAAALEVLLVRLGESLFRRADAGGGDASCAEGVENFRQLQQGIANSEAAIQSVEEQIRRLRVLEESIKDKEREDAERSKDLSALFAELGKMMIDSPVDNGAFADIVSPWRDRVDALSIKVNSLEDRLAELEQKEGGNVFAWIGKNAQGLVMRSFLTRSQDSLEQQYRVVGERGFSAAAAEIGASDAVKEICGEIGQKQADARDLADELAKLRDERRSISSAFSAEGGPLKQIQTLRGHIDHANGELRVLYQGFGAIAAGLDNGTGGGGQKRFADSLLTSDDAAVVDKARRTRQLALDNEREIGKLRASLAIDDEMSKIEHCRKKIVDKKLRITEAEKDIVEFETAIAASEKHIEELRELL